MKQVGVAYRNFSKSEDLDLEDLEDLRSVKVRSWVTPVILHLSFLVCPYFVSLTVLEA